MPESSPNPTSKPFSQQLVGNQAFRFYRPRLYRVQSLPLMPKMWLYHIWISPWANHLIAITDSLSAAKKAVNPSPHSGQGKSLIASHLRSFFDRDTKNFGTVLAKQMLNNQLSLMSTECTASKMMRKLIRKTLIVGYLTFSCVGLYRSVVV